MKRITFVNFNGRNSNDAELVGKLNAVAAHEYPTSHRMPHNLARHILLSELDKRVRTHGIDLSAIQSAAAG